jgi:spore germination protein GerM
VRTVVLRVAALALLLLLAVVGTLTMRMVGRLPDTVVYFVRDTGTGATLESVYRRTASRDAADAARAALASLAAGPTPEEAARGLVSEVPRDLVVRSVRLADGRLEVDLDQSFNEGGGTTAMLGRLNQVLSTLAQPAAVESVALSVDGEPLTVLGGEGIMVAHPWRRQSEGVPEW